MKKGLLPIGSVVLLEGGTRKVMICGYSSKGDDNEKVFDYNGCIFPEGFLENIYLLFDHDQIDTIEFVGYKNDKFEEMMSQGITSKVMANSGLEGPNASSGGSKRRGRLRKAPTNPMSISEMRAKYTTEKISGGQTKKFDFSSLDRK